MKPEQDTKIEMGGQIKLNSNRCIRKRKVKRRNLKRDFPICLILQELYSSCRDVFKPSNGVPSSSDVHSLCAILDRMGLEDLELSKNLQFFNPANEFNGDRRVTYTNIYKCNHFSLVLFFLPASAVIPLHNHPDMTVFSKLLYGKMHIKSYDWVDSEFSKKPSTGQRLAILKANTVLDAPCDTSVLYPTTGDTELGDSLREDDKYAWLEEIEMPEDSRMDGIQYMGPQIIENLW
ncbi:hypothetical protein V2J09_010176 [Rumex salicifolius]